MKIYKNKKDSETENGNVDSLSLIKGKIHRFNHDKTTDTYQIEDFISQSNILKLYHKNPSIKFYYNIDNILNLPQKESQFQDIVFLKYLMIYDHINIKRERSTHFGYIDMSIENDSSLYGIEIKFDTNNQDFIRGLGQLLGFKYQYPDSELLLISNHSNRKYKANLFDDKYRDILSNYDIDLEIWDLYI